MESSQIVKVLNMKTVDALTLDKAIDRLEFEALPMLRIGDQCSCDGGAGKCNDYTCSSKK